jgi:YhcH/YjgK/YiaL family protein
MIIDKLENSSKYFGMNPNFNKAFTFLLQSDLKKMESGKYEIDGDKVYAAASSKHGKDKDEAKLEIHKKYIDIQYLIEGSEAMGWKYTKDCVKPIGEFNSEKDILFYDDKPEVWFNLVPGTFAIFFPDDAHAPMISNENVHKIVVKAAL